jgi:WD40 repeat protein
MLSMLSGSTARMSRWVQALPGTAASQQQSPQVHSLAVMDVPACSFCVITTAHLVSGMCCMWVQVLAYASGTPLGDVLVSGGWDGAVYVWQLWPHHCKQLAQESRPGTTSGGRCRHPQVSGQPGPTCVRRWHGHSGWVTSMLAGRTRVVTASTDRRCGVYEYSREAGEPQQVLLAHPAEVTLVRWADR